MGVYVDYLSSPFANLSTTPNTILSATNHTLFVNGITVCNRSAAVMRFNLQKIRFQTPLPSITIYYINEFEIAAYDSVDVIASLGLQIFLEYDNIINPYDSLVCFSSGYTQVFDCEVSYTKLNET